MLKDVNNSKNVDAILCVIHSEDARAILEIKAI